MKHEYIIVITYSRANSSKSVPDDKKTFSVIAHSHKEAEQKAKDQILRGEKEENFILRIFVHQSRRIWD